MFAIAATNWFAVMSKKASVPKGAREFEIGIGCEAAIFKKKLSSSAPIVLNAFCTR